MNTRKFDRQVWMARQAETPSAVRGAVGGGVSLVIASAVCEAIPRSIARLLRCERTHLAMTDVLRQAEAPRRFGALLEGAFR